jgi:hypothetical protein
MSLYLPQRYYPKPGKNILGAKIGDMNKLAAGIGFAAEVKQQ